MLTDYLSSHQALALADNYSTGILGIVSPLTVVTAPALKGPCYTQVGGVEGGCPQGSLLGFPTGRAAPVSRGGASGAGLGGLGCSGLAPAGALLLGCVANGSAVEPLNGLLVLLPPPPNGLLLPPALNGFAAAAHGCGLLRRSGVGHKPRECTPVNEVSVCARCGMCAPGSAHSPCLVLPPPAPVAPDGYGVGA